MIDRTCNDPDRRRLLRGTGLLVGGAVRRLGGAGAVVGERIRRRSAGRSDTVRQR